MDMQPSEGVPSPATSVAANSPPPTIVEAAAQSNQEATSPVPSIADDILPLPSLETLMPLSEDSSSSDSEPPDPIVRPFLGGYRLVSPYLYSPSPCPLLAWFSRPSS